MDFLEFCKYNFDDNIDQIWGIMDADTTKFYEQKHTCLEFAGIKRGVDYCRDFNFAKDLDLDADNRLISMKGCMIRFNDETYLNENIYRALETFCGTKYEKYEGLDKNYGLDHNDYLQCLDEYGSQPEKYPNA